MTPQVAFNKDAILLQLFVNSLVPELRRRRAYAKKIMNRQHHKRIKFVTLQENLSQILDDILKTGDSIEVEHHGRRFQILPLQSEAAEKPGNTLDHLIARPYLQCEPDDIVHVDWFDELIHDNYPHAVWSLP